jgi:hypothetical protein
LADVGECLELERISGGVEKGSPTSPLEADVGFDDEGDACAAKALRKELPEVRDDLMAEEMKSTH